MTNQTFTAEEIELVWKLREQGLTAREIAFVLVRQKESRLLERLLSYVENSG